MAKTIKGITIEIDAETKGLGSALKDINKSSGELTGELKKVENALKFNPEHTVLLEQKQKLLNDTIIQTEKKLDAMKQAEKEVQSMFKSGEIGEKQYRDFQREVATTESKLSGLKSELSRTNDTIDDNKTAFDYAKDAAEGFNGKLKNVADKASDVGNKMSVGITVPALAAGAAMLSMASDYENAMIKLQANTGATDKEMEEFSVIAKDIYNSGLGESMDGVASAVSNVTGQLSGLQPDEIITATKKAMMLEDILGMDMTESLKGVNSLMSTYGMTADEAFDYVVKGAQGGLNKTDELGDNLSEYARLFAENGYSADEMFEILQTGLDAGAYSLDSVNDLVKEFGIRVGDGTIKTAIEEMGGSWKEIYDVWEASGESNDVLFQKMAANLAAIEDPQERQNALSMIWGSIGEDAGSKVVAAMGAVGDSYGDVTGAAQEIVDAQEAAFGTEVQAAWRDFKDAFLPVGEALIDMFEEVKPELEEFSGYLTDIIEDFNKMPEGSQNFALGVGAVMLALGPAVSILGSFAAGITSIVEFFGKFGPALAAFLGPLAVFGAGVKIIMDTTGTTFEDMKNSFNGSMDQISARLSEHKEYFFSMWSDLKRDTKAAWDELWAGFENPFAGTMDSINSTMQRHKGYWTEAWDILSGKVDSAKETIGNALSSIQSFFDGLDFSLPSIKAPSLPTFSISGEWDLSLADGDGLSAPKVGVTWNADGAIFTKPTIFSTRNGLQGVGEAGAEAILPIDKLPELLGLDKKQPQIDYELMAYSIVDAIVRSGLKIEMDKRQLGRLVGEMT